MVLEFLQAAQELHKLGPKYILIKGGHLIEPPSSTHAQADPNNSTQSTGSSAAGHSGPSAPQTSPEATSAAHDSPAQSSEPAAAASCAEPEPPADASLSEKKNGHGGLSVGQELGDTQSDRHSAAAEQATNLPEGKVNPHLQFIRVKCWSTAGRALHGHRTTCVQCDTTMVVASDERKWRK